MFIDIHVKDSIMKWKDENTPLGKQEEREVQSHRMPHAIM